MENLCQVRNLSALRLGDTIVLRVTNNSAVRLATMMIMSSLMTKIQSATEWYVLGSVYVEKNTFICLDKPVDGDGSFELRISAGDGTYHQVTLSEEEATKLLLFLTNRLDVATPPDSVPAPFEHQQ